MKRKGKKVPARHRSLDHKTAEALRRNPGWTVEDLMFGFRQRREPTAALDHGDWAIPRNAKPPRRRG